MRFILFAFLIFLAACNRPCDKYFHKHPECLLPDTVTVQDTTILLGFEVDTSFITSSGEPEVFTIVKDNVITKIIHHRDTLKVTVTQSPDTLYKEIIVPVETQVTAYKCKWYVCLGAWWGLILTAVVGILIFLLRNSLSGYFKRG